MFILFFLACVLPTQTTSDDTNKHSGSGYDESAEAPA